MEFDFKIRCSAIGQIMAEPRSKSERYSKTLQSYCDDWQKERIYGRKKDVYDRKMQKGVILEDEAIDKAMQWLDLEFCIKNEKTFENDYLCGTPDLILSDEIIDIKCSWDEWSFPLFEREIPTKDYYYQLQGYMALTGKRKARLVYLLLNTPSELNYGTEVIYDSVPTEYRIKTFSIEYNEEVIEKIREKVLLCNEYISQL